MLQGYKTYILAVAAVAYGFIGIFSRWLDGLRNRRHEPSAKTALGIIWDGSHRRGAKSYLATTHKLSVPKKYEELLGALGGAVKVGGGTAWLWSRPDAADTLDVLFVDEAAQMSLANVRAS
jgi:hypothetical protein